MAVALLIATQAAASDGVIPCPTAGCPAVENETLLSTLTATRFWIATEPLVFSPEESGGGKIMQPGIGALGFSSAANLPTHYRFTSNGEFAHAWIDGLNSGGWDMTFHDLRGIQFGWVSVGPGTNGTISQSHILTTGQYGSFDVDSEIVPSNGYDLAGMDMRVTHLSILVGAYTSELVSPGRYRTELPLTFQLFGAPGAMPEPSSFALVVMMGLCRCRIARRRRCT